jgi:hypothetical protein
MRDTGKGMSQLQNGRRLSTQRKPMVASIVANPEECQHKFSLSDESERSSRRRADRFTSRSLLPSVKPHVTLLENTSPSDTDTVFIAYCYDWSQSFT